MLAYNTVNQLAMNNPLLSVLLVCAALLSLLACTQEGTSKPGSVLPSLVSESALVTDRNERPNILLIVADDLGYTDLGVYGGEIKTPNLDSLAKSGVILTDFYAAPACSPTRSMLLSGTDNHLAGLGSMVEHMASNQRGQPGYEGYLNSRVVSVAALLRDAGYQTNIVGKWHLGMAPEQRPQARGFDRSFVILPGGASHFRDAVANVPAGGIVNYWENGSLYDELPESFFSTAFYTDKAIGQITESKQANKPFFSFLAYTAPHWPLQAPDDYIDRYKGQYDEGYEVLREHRIQRAQKAGVVSLMVKSAPRFANVTPWDELTREQKKIESRKMELYAAMVENLDVHVGRVIQHLKDIGEFDNTFIFFMSDNGPEGGRIHSLPGNENWIDEKFDNSYDNMGRINSYIYPGPGWAQANIAPFRWYKGFATEGGIRVPGFVSYRGIKQQGIISNAFTTVMDVVPTFLDLANTKHPAPKYENRNVLPIKGASMLPFLLGDARAVHGDDYVMGWELFGRRAIRQGQWKIVWLDEPYGTGRWQLYNLTVDSTESQDLADQEPERLQAMIALWEQYAQANGVILPGPDIELY